MPDHDLPELPAGWLADPVPNDRAIEFIEGKTPMAASVFKGLLPELKARAIAVAGIESAGVARDVRAALAELPAGADWDKTRRKIADLVSPWTASEDDPKAKQARTRKAELILRTHGFQAYAVAQHEVMREEQDIFPFWQYLTMEDERVRATHSALDKLVFPAESPFWHHHSPPWDWGCRCRKVQLLPEEVEEIQSREKRLPPEKQTVIEGAALDMVERQNKLNRGPSQIVDITPPIEKGKPGAFSFQPDSLRLSPAELQGRYDPQTWAEFQTWAHKTEVEPGTTVWEWMGGKPLDKTQPVQSPAPMPGAGNGKPHKPKNLKNTKPASVTEALQAQNLSAQSSMSIIQASQLVGSLKEAKPALWGSVIKQMNLPASHPVVASDTVTGIVQDFLNFLPPDLVKALPKLTIDHQHSLNGAAAHYVGAGALHLALDEMKSTKLMRTYLYHELTHWVHMELPAFHPWVSAIKYHFADRTAAEMLVPQQIGGITFDTWLDHWFDRYMGRFYGLPIEQTHLGLEFPTK